jgi:hypothetical protein
MAYFTLKDKFSKALPNKEILYQRKVTRKFSETETEMLILMLFEITHMWIVIVL